MKYERILKGTFVKRLNRFVAICIIDGEEVYCHVKNTGRCGEILIEGAECFLEVASNPDRKYRYSLVAVRKGERLINIDSQAPNKAAGEWLASGGLGEISELRPEVRHGDSRYDFSFLKDGKRCFLEVKGCTLEEDGVCAFPDAPTERGAKHIRGLTEAARDGYGAYILFVIQMSDVKYIRPHDETDPAFGAALREAAQNGVQVLAMDCAITPDTMDIRLPVLVKL